MTLPARGFPISEYRARLDRAQREIYERGESAKISDIANHWGFWHMGQFAADYRAQFGELPSTTIKRIRGN